MSGDEHIGTVYGVESAEACQEECEANLYDHGFCYHFTWYESDGKCRLFTECLPSGEMCPDCIKGPVICMTTHTRSTETMPSTVTTPMTQTSVVQDTTTTEGPTTSLNPCFFRGACDISGPEHTGTIYAVTTVDDCQTECETHDSCNFFTWYRDSDKCRLFSDCKDSDEDCKDCITGPKEC